MNAVIIDKHGDIFEPNDWVKAKTFWICNQENLLIQDNQTQKYQNGSEDLKKQLTYWAWGMKL